MANITVLTNSNGTYRLVFHVATPAGNNSAGIPWSTALVNSGKGGSSVLTAGSGTNGTISSADLSAIQAGTLVEMTYQFVPSAAFWTETPTQQQSDLDALYAQATANYLAQLQTQLTYWGMTLS